ncbi:MAG: acyl CoA:acetate/3-ketoacid CoA transferase, partial [Caldivirga sp.]
VFRLTPSGLLLEEYAPGVDIERDILGRMEFKPQISRGLRQMEPELFREQRMGLREVALKLIKQ